MNQTMRHIIKQLMGTATANSRCKPTAVHLDKRSGLQMRAIAELVKMGVAVKTGEKCDGEIYVYESAYNFSVENPEASKAAGSF